MGAAASAQQNGRNWKDRAQAQKVHKLRQKERRRSLREASQTRHGAADTFIDSDGAQVEIIEHDDTATAATNSNAPSHGDTVERNHNDRNENVMGVLGVVRNALNGKGEQESMIGNSSDHKRNARSTPMNENEESDSNFSQSSSSTVPRKRLSVVFTHDGSPVFLRRKTSSSIGGTADSSRRNINRPPLSAHSEQNSSGYRNSDPSPEHRSGIGASPAYSTSDDRVTGTARHRTRSGATLGPTGQSPGHYHDLKIVDSTDSASQLDAQVSLSMNHSGLHPRSDPDLIASAEETPDNESVTVDGISPEEMAAIKEYLGFDLDTRDTTHGSSSADDAVAASAVQPMAMASSTRHQELLRQQMGQMQSQQHPPAQHSPPMYPQSRPTATRHSPVAYTTKLPLPSVHARAETTTGSASTARSSATSGDDGLVVPADWNSNSARGSPLPAAGPRRSPPEKSPPLSHAPPDTISRSATFSIMAPMQQPLGGGRGNTNGKGASVSSCDSEIHELPRGKKGRFQEHNHSTSQEDQFDSGGGNSTDRNEHVSPHHLHRRRPSNATATEDITNSSEAGAVHQRLSDGDSDAASISAIQHRVATDAGLQGIEVQLYAGAGPTGTHPHGGVATTGGGRYPAQVAQVAHLDDCTPAVRRALALLGVKSAGGESTTIGHAHKVRGPRGAPTQCEDWEQKVDALQQLDRLLTPEKLPSILPAVDIIAHAMATIAIPYAKTSVSKPALRLLARMCDVLGPCLDADINTIVTALSAKVGSSSGRRSFIHAEVVQALHSLASNVSLALLVPVFSEHLGKCATTCKDVLAAALLQAMKCGEPAEMLYCVPHLLEIGAQLVPDAGLRPWGVKVLQFLQGTPGWSEATVDEYLQGRRRKLVLDILHDAKHKPRHLPRGSHRSPPQGGLSPRPVRASISSSSSTTSTRASRIRRPNASGGLPRILTQIKLGVQSKQWQERDTALARLHNEVLRKTQYAPAHTSTIVRELLLPACGDANGKVQVNALAATVECIERYYESIDARTCATMIQTLGGLLASNNTMTFTATAAALDRMIVHCVKPYLIKPWCLLINSEKSLKVKKTMLDKLRRLVAVGYATASPQIAKHVVPQACRWLTAGLCVPEVQWLCRVLFAEMEDEVLTEVEQSASDVQQAVVHFMEHDLYRQDT